MNDDGPGAGTAEAVTTTRSDLMPLTDSMTTEDLRRQVDAVTAALRPGMEASVHLHGLPARTVQELIGEEPGDWLVQNLPSSSSAMRRRGSDESAVSVLLHVTDDVLVDPGAVYERFTVARLPVRDVVGAWVIVDGADGSVAGRATTEADALRRAAARNAQDSVTGTQVAA